MLSYVFMMVIGIILFILLFWMVFILLKLMEEIVCYFLIFFLEKIVWENYLDMIVVFFFWCYVRNILFIIVLVVIGNVFLNFFIVYGFVKFDFFGKKLMFVLVFFMMMILGFVMMIF